MFEHIFDCLYVGYGIHIKSWEIIILFSMCRYAQSCAFISVIELPRIPAYCPKQISQAEKQIAIIHFTFAMFLFSYYSVRPFRVQVKNSFILLLFLTFCICNSFV